MFEKFKDELFAAATAKGFVDYELFYYASDGFSVRVLNGEISEYKNSSTEGVGFRGTYNGKMGYSYTEKLDANLIPQLIENAAENAMIIEEEDVEKLYPGDEKYPECKNHNPSLNNFDATKKIQMALDMESYALSLDARVKMADYCTVSNSESTMNLANSHGLNLSDKWNMGNAFLVARVEENGITKSGYDFWEGRDFSQFDYKKLAQKAVKTALSYLGAKSINTGDYPVIFDNNTTRDVFEAFCGIFMAESGQKGFSLLNKSKIGETIAAPHINLRDDGITEHSLRNIGFDSEGVATKQKAIIENGILKTLLYNTKAAAKDGVKSTGNASKQGFGGAIGTSVNNMYLVPGETSFDDMVKGLDKGVIITELAGMHSGSNAVSGDFSFSADGFLIENGKITKPIEQITVAGNFFGLLKSITIVGNDLRFQGQMGMPSILVENLSIAGL